MVPLRTKHSFPKPGCAALVLLATLIMLQVSRRPGHAQDAASPDLGSVNVKGAFVADDLATDEAKPASTPDVVVAKD
jgi:hypothetical protein